MGQDEKPDGIFRTGLLVLKNNAGLVPSGENGTLMVSGSVLYIDNGTTWAAV